MSKISLCGSLLLVALLFALAPVVNAQTVTVYIDAGQLLNATGTSAEPVGGLLQLIASPSGNFSAPNSSSYVTGDNVLISSFAMNNNGGTNETFNQVSFSLTATVTVGESLLLRFYPNVTLAGMPAAPPLATTYGQVRSATIEFGPSGGVPGETAWVVPSAGAAVNIEYVTISNGGTYSNASADAGNVVLVGVVPEPATWAALGFGVFALVALQARRQRRA